MAKDSVKMASRSGPLPATLVRLSAPSGDADCPRLVFCPDVGGNVLYARPLVQALAGEAECHGLRLSAPMLARLDKLTLAEIATGFATDIAAADFPGPVHIAGFSFAAYMAVETARQMAELGRPPARVWILDMAARRQLGVTEIVRYALGHARSSIGLGQKPSDVLHRPGFLRLDLSKHPDGYRPILRRMYRLYSHHRPARVPGPVTVVIAEDSRRSLPNSDLGWSRCVTGDVSCVTVPGDHLGMLRDPANARAVADRLRTRFAADRARDGLARPADPAA